METPKRRIAAAEFVGNDHALLGAHSASTG
jgi:hypothetical protein